MYIMQVVCVSRPGGFDPEELEKEFGDSVEYLCARLKLAHSDKQVGHSV